MSQSNDLSFMPNQIILGYDITSNTPALTHFQSR